MEFLYACNISEISFCTPRYFVKCMKVPLCKSTGYIIIIVNMNNAKD